MPDNKDGDKKRPGRPNGYRMTEKSKNKIRQKRIGKNHSDETKQKISKSLAIYFKNKEVLSNSVGEEYNYLSDEVSKWIMDNKEALDKDNNIMAESRLAGLRQLELCYGKDIEIFGHNTTPEFLLIIKEELSMEGKETELQTLFSLL